MAGRCTRPSLPYPRNGRWSEDLTDVLNSQNRAAAASLVVPSEYLEVAITRLGY
jgi:hypothetical protein